MTDPDGEAHFDVYLGVWTNWSRGRILGATLTLERTYGLLLLSFTATFVGFVASRSWRIITLVLHRIYSTPEPRDALHHQRQVVLRNSLSAASTLWTSLQLVWCWWAIADGYLARILPTIVFAASVFCAFTVAGGFTSSISTSVSNDVLIKGSQCGTLPEITIDTISVLYPHTSQFINNAANYAQQCYSLNSTGTLECGTFVKNRLQYSSTINASCPFNDNICRSNDSNLLLDSGLISSDDVGLNLPSTQRMFWRQALHCAPLKTDGFSKNVSTRYNNFTRYSYSIDPEWTYEAESLESKYQRNREFRSFGGKAGFDILALGVDMANGTAWLLDHTDFIPIPQLTVPDADLLLVFLSPEGIIYLNRTDDPWYRGTAAYVDAYKVEGGDPHTAYISDEAASPMGCTQRYQYCNSNKECGKLGSWADAASSAMPLFHLDPSDFWSDTSPDSIDGTAGRFIWFQNTLFGAGLTDLLTGLGPSSLLSIQHSFQNFMGPLPDNQWQLDVTHWFEMVLASLQACFVDTARGPSDEAVLPYLEGPQNEYERAMCQSQKIRSTNFTSLSLFGLYFTYVTGFIIILASYITEPLLSFYSSRRKYEEYKYLEWAANGTLQLQRLAYQGLGSEKWTNYTDEIPKTRPGYFLADLARAYPAEDDSDEVQEVKPTVHAGSTTTPSVSEATVNLSVPEQHNGVPSRPDAAVAEPIPQAVPRMWQALPPTPQPMSPHSQVVPSSLQASSQSPQAVSAASQNVSPVSQVASPISPSGAALGNQGHHSSPNMAYFAGQLQNSPRDGRQGERSVPPTDRLPGYF